MPRTRRRPLLRLLPAAAALGGLLLAGPATGTAAAAPVPCPTVGTTVAKDASPNLRVYRQGAMLKACVRSTGKRRTVRTLGVWTSGTTVATGAGTVAWTSTGRSDEHGLVDAIATVDVRSGRRWFRTDRAALSPDVATPAADDRVLRLVTDSRATAWVTSRGLVGVAVRRLDRGAMQEWGRGPEPYRVGRRYFLGDAGVAGAAAVAHGLALRVGGERDDCGGTDVFSVDVPAFGATPARSFVYAAASASVDPDVC